MTKLHLFDLLWICCTTSCTTNPQQIHDKSIAYNKSTASRHVEMLWICCTTIPSPQQIHNKSKQWSLDSIYCGLVVASQPIRELMLMTTWRTCDVTNFCKQMVVIIGKMDSSVENLRPIQLTTGSWIDAYRNKSVLWDTMKNSSEEDKELAWIDYEFSLWVAG